MESKTKIKIWDEIDFKFITFGNENLNNFWQNRMTRK